jgi:CheY-like chemotaxis protein
VRQLKRLVDDLLDSSRLSTAKLQIRTQHVELRTVLERAVESARPYILDCGHELAVRLGDERLWLQADPARLEQIFVNLLNNAARYTGSGGQIELETRRDGEHAVVTVGDNGIGIPSEMLERIFDMFTQVNDPAHHCHEGLGIGLTLVKRLTEMHGGSVAVRSNGPQQGSEITVRLPLAMKLAELAAPARCDDADECSGLKILIADDNRDTATMLRIILKNWGNHVRTVHDGLEAVVVASSLHPDAMIIDLEMTKLGGCEVARQLRQQPWGRGMLLIAATGWGQEEDRRRTTEAGFDYHLTKPFELTELQKLLSHFQRMTLPVSQAQTGVSQAGAGPPGTAQISTGAAAN